MSPALFGGRLVAGGGPTTALGPAVPANIHVPKARIMFCVPATNDDPHANHDATHDGGH